MSSFMVFFWFLLQQRLDDLVDVREQSLQLRSRGWFVFAFVGLALETRGHLPFANVIDETDAGWTPVSSRAAGVRARVAQARSNHPIGDVLSHYVSPRNSRMASHRSRP